MLTWLLSGHGPFNAYLSRFKKGEGTSCECGAKIQDSIHVLFRCTEGSLVRKRANLRNQGVRWEVPSDIIRASKKSPEKLSEIVQELAKMFTIRNEVVRSPYLVPVPEPLVFGNVPAGL